MDDQLYLLYLFDQNQWRRPLAIQALLKGKRTVSNLYAGLDYDLLPLYQLLPHLVTAKFQQALTQLLAAGLLVQQERTIRLTAAGVAVKEKYRNKIFLPTYYSGFEFHYSHEFSDRLFLATQVVSELQAHNRRYFPLNVSFVTQQRVKQWLQQQDISLIAERLQHEWELLLAALPVAQADYYSQFLLGHQVERATTAQADQLAGWTALTGELVRQDISHHLLHLITTQAARFPLMATLWQPLASGLLSKSAAQTMSLLQQGLSLSMISRRRQVKLNTLKEHLLEAAILLPDFSFNTYLSAPARQILTEKFAEQPLAQWRYEQLATTKLSFFEFRLYQIERRKADD
ncbi:helix-turn-helix domain-containing protein [Loigolactobacillus zhaoyuanensis]|uniref:helix-turn-helix domain-containing protein n=1 Tax=Loigolactobacillus zhaoyuanensis TaxID=2486017 RepID=UPI000F744552|nr:helix-turn-helix domain-containing protein [Loigolactobacillus zhaoyuanensis]